VHQRAELVRDFKLWRGLLTPDARVAFHDYGDPGWPGVAEAVNDLGLTGEAVGSLFVSELRGWDSNPQPTD
jgi:hypothetical protein